MLTPDDIQKKIFTLGRKLENNDVGIFVKEMQINYQLVYDQANEQAKQISGMEKKLKYYRDVESNLQDALVHAEKVSETKIKEAEKTAAKIEENAHKKAEDIIADAKSELAYLKSIIVEFEKSYDSYQDKYKDFIMGQLKFIEDSKKFMDDEKINVKRFVSNIEVEPSVSKDDEEELDILDDLQDNEIEEKESVTTFKMPQFEMPKVSVEEPTVDDSISEEQITEEPAAEVVNEDSFKSELKENVEKEEIVEKVIDGDETISSINEEVVENKDINEVVEERIEDDAPEFSLSDVDNGVVADEIKPTTVVNDTEITKEEASEKVEVPVEEQVNEQEILNDKSLNEDTHVVDDKPEEVEVQAKPPKKELFSFASIMNKGKDKATKESSFELPKPEPKPEPVLDMPSTNEEPKKEIKLDNFDKLDEDLSDDAMTNTDDLFDLPEIDVDDLDFSNLNFSSSVPTDTNSNNMPTTGVDFNAMNTPPSAGVDFDAMNTPPSAGVDFNAMNTPPSAGVDFNAMNTPPSAGVDFNAINTPPVPSTDFDAMDIPPVSGVDLNTINTPQSSGVDFNPNNISTTSNDDINKVDDLDDMGPSLDQNNNIELTFANQSMFSKKKTDEKEKLLASLNISSNKDEEKAKIRQLESNYARDLLNSNQQLASQGVPMDIEDKPQRGYGPADYVSENNGFAAKPLNPEANHPERKSLF